MLSAVSHMASQARHVRRSWLATEQGPGGRRPAEAQCIEIGVQMQSKATTPAGVSESAETGSVGRAQWRAQCRDLALQSALRKREAGVPTYTVAETAALFSVSQEHMYRLVRAGAFPSVQLRIGGDQGRYVVPAQAVESLLAAAAESGGYVDAQEWTQSWTADQTRRTDRAPHVAGRQRPASEYEAGQRGHDQGRWGGAR